MKQKELKNKAGTVLYEQGDAIRGERITAQYRKMTKALLVHGTSTHQIRHSKLEGSVFCIIDKPLNYLRQEEKY